MYSRTDKGVPRGCQLRGHASLCVCPGDVSLSIDGSLRMRAEHRERQAHKLSVGILITGILKAKLGTFLGHNFCLVEIALQVSCRRTAMRNPSLSCEA